MASIRLIILLLCLGASHARAQNFSEWFRQKSTQKKYLLQQIAALNIYRAYAGKGYAIAKGGLGAIGKAASREFSLHTGYYDRLRTVSPVVRNEPQVKMILQRQQDILRQTAVLKQLEGLTTSEQVYVRAVCTELLTDCEGQLRDLEIILGNTKADMSDEERFRQIARLHDSMQDNYQFAVRFTGQLQRYQLQKRNEQRDNNTVKRIYENN